MSIWRLLLFITLLISVMGAGHYYLWRRLVRDAGVPQPYKRLASLVLVLLLGTVPLTMMLMRRVPREDLAPFAYLAFGWMGVFSTFVSVLVCADVARKVIRKFRSSKNDEDVENPERRATLGKLFAGGVVATGTAMSGVALGKVIAGFSVVEVEVKLDKLPKTFDGFKIAQLSDIHVGPTIGREFMDRMVNTANSLGPDLVAITGDLVDGSVKHLSRHTAPLARLNSTHGTYFVTGNHEYYSGADDWIRELNRIGIPTLRNDFVRLQKGGDAFVLAGVTDHRAGSFGDGPDLEFALRKRKAEEEVVLLAHQPREITEAQKHDVGLQLSGHTHGGQFWPWNWVVHLVQPVVAGLAKFGRTQIYVNSGTGYWGPPMRLGTDSEITLVTLRSTSA